MTPVVGLLVSSFRPAALIAKTGWWTAPTPPFDFTLDLYRRAFGSAGMGQSFLNSLYIAIPATVIPILVAAFAAYAFAWMEFPGRDRLFILVVGLLVVPLQMTLIPVLRIYNALHLSGTFVGIWLAHTAYGLPFAVYLLRNFIGSLPPNYLNRPIWTGPHPLRPFSVWRCRFHWRQSPRWPSFNLCGSGMTCWLR